MSFPKMLEYIQQIVWLNLQQSCTMLIGMWFFSVKPEVHEGVVFWRADMFYTHRKL